MPQERIDWFAVVLEGRIRILQLFANGVSSLIGILKPSYVLGADLIYTDSRLSPYYAMADSPCKILIYPRNLLTAEDSLPEPVRAQILRRMMVLLSQDNMRKHYRLAILSQHGLRSRVLVYLAMQAFRRGSSTFQVPFTRDEMADFLCVNRSALSHELSRMRADGLIEFKKNEFTLLPAGMEQSLWSTDK